MNDKGEGIFRGNIRWEKILRGRNEGRDRRGKELKIYHPSSEHFRTYRRENVEEK